MTHPLTQYARSAGVHVAWQELGEGPRDLLFVQGWVSNIEANWEFEEIGAFLRRLAALGRLIIFDKRGTGLSDRVARMPTMDERMDDVRAVLEAARACPAIVFGASEGCALAILFAATYPERTSGLVLYGGYARRSPAPDYPWAPSPEARRVFLDAVLEHWGGPMDLSTLAPSRAGDPKFVAQFAAYLRASASPGTAHALARMNSYIDVRDALRRIRAPTLVLHRRGDRDFHPDEGRYLADRIPGASFVLLEGDDHWPFVGDSGAVLEAIERFAASLPEPPRAVAPGKPASRPARRVDAEAARDPRVRRPGSQQQADRGAAGPERAHRAPPHRRPARAPRRTDSRRGGGLVRRARRPLSEARRLRNDGAVSGPIGRFAKRRRCLS
jgi:pimeloyl-ACP methyl ester carboxylesterase